MGQTVRRLIADEQGATAIEYGLIAALVAIIAIAGMMTLGNTLSSVFNFTANKATGVWDNAGN